MKILNNQTLIETSFDLEEDNVSTFTRKRILEKKVNKNQFLAFTLWPQNSELLIHLQKIRVVTTVEVTYFMSTNYSDRSIPHWNRSH